MGILGVIADQYYLKGIKSNYLNNFDIAYKLFPFERSLVIGKTETFIKFKIVNSNSFEEVKKAVRYDPYSIEFLSFQLQNAFVFGDKKIASQSFKTLKTLFPNTWIVKEMVKRGAK